MEDSDPKVSIIIPVKNGESVIGDLLDSLMNLDYDPEKLEIIVVDGKSVDRTRDIAAMYPVKVVSEEGSGLNAARNTGIRYSRGEVVAFIDADCVAPREWIRKVVKNFEDERVGCTGGNVRAFGDDFFSLYADHSLIPVMPFLKKRMILDGLKPFRYPAGCNMAFRREAIIKAGYFDEEIHYGFDDLEFIERVGKAGYNIALDPDVLVLHKHRTTLLGLLRQMFRYGRGGGIVLRRRGLSTSLSRWLFLCVLIFFSCIFLVTSLVALYLLLHNPIFYYVLLGLVLASLSISMGYYALKGPRRGRVTAVIVYPFIDLLRCIVFCVGEVYQLVRGRKT